MASRRAAPPAPADRIESKIPPEEDIDVLLRACRIFRNFIHEKAGAIFGSFSFEEWDRTVKRVQENRRGK